jgi:hypothetical protein
MLPRCGADAGLLGRGALEQFVRHTRELFAGVREHCVKVFNSSVENFVEKAPSSLEIARQSCVWC